MQPKPSPNALLAQALGVETAGLSKLVLTLQPGKPPLIEASYLIRAAGQVSECVRRLELVCGPAETPPPTTTEERPHAA